MFDRVLVIGNGFDLDMGYHTSYSDFMSWLSSQKGKEVFNSHLYLHLKRQHDLHNWIDIENELKNYSESLNPYRPGVTAGDISGINKKLESFRDEYNEICTLLKEYLSIQQEEIMNPDKINRSKASKLLSMYSYHDRSLLISFNYTNFISNSSKFKVHHVHGNLKGETFVFGIEDDANVIKPHSFLYKSHNPGLNVNRMYEMLDNAKEITFFGYSLGQTDHSYFDDFFKRQSTDQCKRKCFIFYYYGEEAYDDLFWQLRTLTGKRMAKFKQFNEIHFIDIKKDDILDPSQFTSRRGVGSY